jgi:hypothetical protein
MFGRSFAYGLAMLGLAVGLLAGGAAVVSAQDAGGGRRLPDIMAGQAGPGAGAVQGGAAQPGAARGPASQTTSSQATGSQGAASQRPGNQVQDTAPADTTALGLVDDVRISTPEPTTRLRSRLADAVRAADPALRDKITVEGKVRYEDAAPTTPGEVRKRAVVSWQSVSREDTGRREVLAKPLVSSFTIAGDVRSGTPVTASGDVEGAIAAARRLLQDGAQKDDKAGSAQTTKSDQAGVADSGKRPASTGGDGTAQNSLLRNFQGAKTASAAAEPAPPADVYGETFDGCTPKPDLTQGVVIVQAKQTKNGTPQGDCYDTLTRYPVQKSYTVCPDLVVAAEKKAYAQYKLYYVEGGGSTTYLSETCEKDAEAAFDLTEDPSSCTVDIDLPNLKAYKRAETVYTNKNGTRVVQAPCHRVEGVDAAVITKSEDSCSPRHDFTARVSYQKKMSFYSFDSQVSIAQGCTETGVTYAHAEDRTCPPLVDQNAAKAWSQRKWKITLEDGTVDTIADCAPIVEEVSDITKTRSGCEGQYTHNVEGGQSFGHTRWFYNLGGGPQYVTSCQQDTSIVFTHLTRIADYENSDATKTAKPKTEIYFVDGGQEVIASAAQVRAGAPDVPYTAGNPATKDVLTGEVEYAGCNATYPTARSEVWMRPNGSEYDYATGAGTPQGPVDVCTQVVQSRTVTTTYVYSCSCGSECGYAPPTNTAANAYASRTKKTNAFNGFSSTTAWNQTGGTPANFYCNAGFGQTYIGGATVQGTTCTAQAGGTQAELCAAGTY